MRLPASGIDRRPTLKVSRNVLCAGRCSSRGDRVVIRDATAVVFVTLPWCDVDMAGTDGRPRARIWWIILSQVVVAGVILVVAPPFGVTSGPGRAPTVAVPASPQPPAAPVPLPPPAATAPPAATTPPPRTITAAGRLRGVALSPDGVSVAASGENQAWIWNIGEGVQLATIDLDGCGGTDLAYHPLRSLLAIGCRDGRLWLWESSDRPAVALRSARPGRITDVTFGPDGHLLATASENGSVEIWDVDARRTVGGPIDVEVISPGTHRGGGVQSVAFDPGGTMLAIPAGQRVSIWKLADRAVAKAIDIGDLAVSVAYSSDGRGLLIGNAVGTLAFRWLVEPMAIGPKLTGADGQVRRVAWVGEDRYVVAGSGRAVQVWDTSGGLNGSLRGGPAFAVSKDSMTIATFEPDSPVLLLYSTGVLMPYLR
jgi:WD40 repeat protein